MRTLSKLVLAIALLLLALSAFAQAPMKTSCTRSANLLACSDSLGNFYSVAAAGNIVYLRGFEADSRRFWAQTNSRYGQLTFFTGLASDGESWVGYSRRVGWTTINHFSSSGGSVGRFTCARVGGCQGSR
ncbi:glutamine synthetase [Pseudomonas sp. SMV71]|uniref:glutamine synthetase n=1 Tax=Pseudomonas sp. SMV71 TaxID=3390195 RepID=UPI003F86852E